MSRIKFEFYEKTSIICGIDLRCLLVNAQEEKTIDLDEVTIQASSDYKEEKTVNLYPPKDQVQRSMDGLDLTRRMSLPRLCGRSEYEKYLYGEWKRSVAYKWRVGFFLRSRSPLAGGYQTGWNITITPACDMGKESISSWII